MSDLLGEGAESTGSALLRSGAAAANRVGWAFILLYAAAYMGTILLFLAPLLVTLALKIASLVGIDRAPNSLALVAGVGALVAMVANPFFGRMSDRTVSRLGMRRPWMLAGLVGGSLGILIVALAPSVPVVLVGWCLAQLSFNALQAALVAVLPDQVPVDQRGSVAGVLGVCLPIASVSGTFLVQLFTGNPLAMFMVPCAVGGLLILLFAVTLDDRRLEDVEHGRPWSLRQLVGTFYLSPRKSPDFAWAFVSRFLFVLAYALLFTYQAYYLVEKIGSAERGGAQADLPRHARPVRRGRRRVPDRRSALRPDGSAEDLRLRGVRRLRLGDVRRSRSPADVNGFLVGMAIGGLGFGLYMAVDLALVVDVLPGTDDAAKNLGVLNIAAALPASVAPAIAPVVLALGGGYGLLYAVAGGCAVLGAFAILPVRRVR